MLWMTREKITLDEKKAIAQLGSRNHQLDARC